MERNEQVSGRFPAMLPASSYFGARVPEQVAVAAGLWESIDAISASTGRSVPYVLEACLAWAVAHFEKVWATKPDDLPDFPQILPAKFSGEVVSRKERLPEDLVDSLRSIGETVGLSRAKVVANFLEWAVAQYLESPRATK